MKKIAFKEYLLFAEAWCFLAFARLLLIIVPFKRIAPLLGKMKHHAASIENNTGNELRAIQVAIFRGCRFSPWRTKCFEQAIAAKLMLRSRKINSLLYLGVFKDADNHLRAHAWLKTGEIIVTGGPDVSKYTIVNWFSS